MKHLLTVVCFLLLLSPCLKTEAQLLRGFTDRQIELIGKAVKDEMEQQKIVGASVGIVLRGKIVLAKGYGMADIEEQRPATEKTIYNWASNSKPVMAVAAMQLVEAGKLDLDADIRTYVPRFPEKNHVVTTRQLLCHQSGIPHYSNGKIIGLPNEGERGLLDEIDPVFALDRFSRSPLLFPPGEKYSYSSYAYVLLSAVVQSAGKQPIMDQLNERIFEPLEMRSAQLDMPFDNQPEWTTAYFRDRQGEIKRVQDVAHYWKHGAGGYKSDIRDFARWAQALVNTELVTVETEQLMWTDQNTSEGNPTGYGLGFSVSVSDDGVLHVGHGGSQEETRTSMSLSPAGNQAFVVMCNTANAKPDQIVAAVQEVVNSFRAK